MVEIKRAGKNNLVVCYWVGQAEHSSIESLFEQRECQLDPISMWLGKQTDEVAPSRDDDLARIDSSPKLALHICSKRFSQTSLTA